MKSRWMVLLAVLVMLGAACGDDSSGDDAAESSTTVSESDDSVDDGDGSGELPGTGGLDDSGEAGGDEIDNGASGDDDDSGDISADPDSDPEDLPDDVADAVDDIDDIVSVGDCVAETIGIGAVAPDGWFCTVLDTPIPGFDGFTLKSPESGVEITIGSPPPVGPCDFAGFCDNVSSVDIAGFGDAFMYAQLGVAGGVYGSHDELPAVLTVTKIGTVLTDEEVEFVQDYLATLTVL